MKKAIRYLVIPIACASFLAAGGCTKKPSQQELTRLEESRMAAEAAEKKLSELRQERMELEATLEAKKKELQKLESERDATKSQVAQ